MYTPFPEISSGIEEKPRVHLPTENRPSIEFSRYFFQYNDSKQIKKPTIIIKHLQSSQIIRIKPTHIRENTSFRRGGG